MESKPENLFQLVGNEMKNPDASQFHDLTFKSVLDALPCYLTIQDANLNILFVNQTFMNDFENGIGKSYYKVFHGTEHKCSECPVQKTFADKQVHVAEEIILLKDDTVNQMIVYSAPLFDIFGRVSAVIKILTNVNMIKEVQKELVTIGQSFALLTHDIKNMLEGLEGGAYVVDEGLKDQDWQLTTKGWQIVSKNVAEIYRVTQDVLYSSKKRTTQFPIGETQRCRPPGGRTLSRKSQHPGDSVHQSAKSLTSAHNHGLAKHCKDAQQPDLECPGSLRQG